MVATSIPEALADPVPPPDIAFSNEVVVHQVVHQQGDHQDAGAVPDLRKDVHQGPARGQSDATQHGLHRARAKHRRAWPGSSAQSPATNWAHEVRPKSCTRSAAAPFRKTLRSRITAGSGSHHSGGKWQRSLQLKEVQHDMFHVTSMLAWFAAANFAVCIMFINMLVKSLHNVLSYDKTLTRRTFNTVQTTSVRKLP